ncbi:Acetyltransferase (GNAT) family protein [Flavimaricola marinus]|uniref:Acetyltransferase (GNAT) family protein n=1 Tax=Flavimaricola marinus TaxID=1819565 RepID=A0A238LJ75_9RHOB|nr:Acetyltransferase (GNAT) family protein [Flavimaricola marinus]
MVGPVSALMIEAWPEWYGPGGQGDAAADLAKRGRHEGLPSGLVALVADAPVGTVALDATSYGAEPGEGPWMTGLVVCPKMRGRGIATALVAGAERFARALGYPEIHTATITASGLIRRQGWTLARSLDNGYDILRLALG